MLNDAFIKSCADPSLKPAIVRQFVDAVGADDPLTITIRSGERLILVPKPRSPSEALELIHQYLGRASVRVGLTQYPAGIGLATTGEKQPGIIEPCDNLKMGTAMFAKVMRIVARSFARSNAQAELGRIFEAAVVAWRTGFFEGKPIFSARDPGLVQDTPMPGEDRSNDAQRPDPLSQSLDEPSGGQDIGKAGIRVDLTRIGQN